MSQPEVSHLNFTACIHYSVTYFLNSRNRATSSIVFVSLGVEVYLQAMQYSQSHPYSFSSKYPKGIVSWQSPTENDSIRKGFGVRIEVSNGLAPNDLVDVPDFQGIFLNEALKIIQEKGFFEGKIQYVENKKFLPNTVLNQSPKEGTKVSQGCLLYTSPSPRDKRQSRMPSSA